jgi:hypothetical protein
VNAARGPERTSRGPPLLEATGVGPSPPAGSEPPPSAAGVPRELSPSSARDVHGWVDNYWEQEARWLGVRVERLERQLRRRTVVLGSSLALLSGGAVGAIVAFLFSMPPFDQHHQLVVRR